MTSLESLNRRTSSSNSGENSVANDLLSSTKNSFDSKLNNLKHQSNDPICANSLPNINKIATNKNLDVSSVFLNQIHELKFWDHKLKSGLALSLISLLFYLTFGDEGWNIVSLVCWLLVIRIVSLSTLRHVLDAVEASTDKELKPIATLVEQLEHAVDTTFVIPSSGSISHVVHGTGALVESHLTRLFSFFCKASEPSEEGKSAFKALLAYLLITIFSLRFISVSTIFFLFAFYEITCPAIYSSHQNRIDETWAIVWEKMSPSVDAMKGTVCSAAEFVLIKLRNVFVVINSVMRPVYFIVLKSLGKFLKALSDILCQTYQKVTSSIENAWLCRSWKTNAHSFCTFVGA